MWWTDGRTDGETQALAFTVLAQRPAVKIRLHFHFIVGNLSVIRINLHTSHIFQELGCPSKMPVFGPSCTFVIFRHTWTKLHFQSHRFFQTCPKIYEFNVGYMATPWTYFLHLSLSSVILIDSSTRSPVHVSMLAWIDNVKTWQDSLWKSQSEWQRIEINGESTSTMWPTLGSRTAKEQNRTQPKIYEFNVGYDCNLYT